MGESRNKRLEKVQEEYCNIPPVSNKILPVKCARGLSSWEVSVKEYHYVVLAYYGLSIGVRLNTFKVGA
jgi:hypothetical protein